MCVLEESDWNSGIRSVSVKFWEGRVRVVSVESLALTCARMDCNFDDDDDDPFSCCCCCCCFNAKEVVLVSFFFVVIPLTLFPDRDMMTSLSL